VGLRIAEVHQCAVAHVFATNPPNRFTVSATHFW
jgi:hypothetical protein